MPFFFALVLALMSLDGCCFDPSRTSSPGASGAATPARSGPEPSAVQPIVAEREVLRFQMIASADPVIATGTARGSVDAQTFTPECTGFVAADPDHRIDIADGHPRLMVHSREDTTLVVRRPDGSFACVDDTFGVDPVLEHALTPGLHDVWIGTYVPQGGSAPYVLAISSNVALRPDALDAHLRDTPETIGSGGHAPIQCGLTEPSYGALRVGSRVVLAQHAALTQGAADRRESGTQNWVPEMRAYVGQRTSVVAFAGLDEWGCSGVHVAADEGRFFWRIRDLLRDDASSGVR